MKRSQMYKKVNRRNNVLSHFNRNVVYPSLFLSPGEINKQGSVEIIELKSDEEPEQVQRDKSNYGHVWCDDGDDQDKYKINKEARERRRCRVEYDNDEIYNELLDQMCTNFYEIDCHNSHDGTSGNHDAKCFTIINNNLSYDTSSDDEELDFSDTTLNGNETKERSFDNASYSNGYAENRTVFIYSEKNKELLSDYDTKKNPNRNSSSSSTDNEDPIKDFNLGCIRRLATPIPTYIPKLYLPLSPNLPTVTEVMESYIKSSSNTEINESNTMTPQKPINNWVQAEPVEDGNLYHRENNKTFTWDTLSPREKRRIKNSINEDNYNINKINQETTVVVNQSESPKKDIIEKEKEHQNEFTTNELHLKSRSSEDINKLRKPQIKFNRKIKPSSEIITEPLEKENGKWIGDETDETLDVYDYDLDQTDAAKETSDVEFQSYNRGKQFLVSNMSLLKPMEWTQYLPITGSIPSLHLSLETEIEENKSCLKRLFNCFKCCKRY